MKLRWLIKRKPTRKSFFRDGFPYFQRFAHEGHFWVREQKKGRRFKSLEKARKVLRKIRKQDKDVRIVVIGKRGQKTRKMKMRKERS